MQTINVDASSELANALAASADSNESVFLIMKTQSGESIYRGLVNGWTARATVTGHSLEITLQDWDKYWGDIAARKFYA